MDPFKFKNKVLAAIIMSCLFASGSVRALDEGSSTPLRLPDWVKLSLSAPTVLKEIYANSIADSVFIKLKRDTFLPPVQYFSRKESAGFEADYKAIGGEILTNLGVDLNSKTTLLMKNASFKTGPAHSLNGRIIEYQSSDGHETYVTCMAFVEEKNRVHAIYVQAFQTSLPKCATQLSELAHSPDLLK